MLSLHFKGETKVRLAVCACGTRALVTCRWRARLSLSMSSHTHPNADWVPCTLTGGCQRDDDCAYELQGLRGWCSSTSPSLSETAMAFVERAVRFEPDRTSPSCHVACAARGAYIPFACTCMTDACRAGSANWPDISSPSRAPPFLCVLRPPERPQGTRVRSCRASTYLSRPVPISLSLVPSHTY